ncbi:hypothetical protein PROFUN_12697 [Planoprotostelium fungivorum]|uniref:Dynein regulatory complex protein 12 n=1 Tax=Planoprotostelium fungivorum TaxID=1890364 RepID=A0A2P6N6X9_9EUKA|nr:hypothetical protein PROFUN_12697 [Planoprotostelium fungivorum]
MRKVVRKTKREIPIEEQLAKAKAKIQALEYQLKIPIEEQLAKAKAKIQALEYQLTSQGTALVRGGEEKDTLRLQIRELNVSVLDGEGNTRDVFSEMTRQYRNMEKELMNRVNRLEDENLQLQEQLEIMFLVQEEIKRAKDRQLADRDVVIADQNRKLESITTECSQMMKELFDALSVDNAS